MYRRLVLLFLVALCCAHPGSTPRVVEAEAQSYSTLPEVYAGLSASEARALRAEIKRLSEEREVREATLVAIAERLRVNYSTTSFSTLLEVLNERANEAEAFRYSLARLEQDFSRISFTEKRDVAADLLSQAQFAFDAGDLDLASELLHELTPMRRSELQLGIENWEQIVSARANIMVLSGAALEALKFRREASESLKELTRQSRFRLMFDGAADAVREGERLEGVELLRIAIDTFNSDVITLAPRDVAPKEWASTKRMVCNAQVTYGTRLAGDESRTILLSAIDSCAAALEVWDKSTDYSDWANAMNDIGNAYFRLGEDAPGELGTAYLITAIDAFETVLSENPAQSVLVGMMLMNYGNAITKYVERTPDAPYDIWQSAIDAFERALTIFSEAETPNEWALTNVNLANTYLVGGMRIGGVVGRSLNNNAVDALENSLRVYDKTKHPSQWSRAQATLGNTLVIISNGSEGDSQRAYIDRAKTAFSRASEVSSKESTPAAYARNQVGLGSCSFLEWQIAATKSTQTVHAEAALMHFSEAREVLGKDHYYSAQLTPRIDLLSDWLQK